MPRPGWTKLPGASERYRSPSGEIVSRRQYDNARYIDAGWRNRADFERRYNDSTYKYLVDKIAHNAARESGKSSRELRAKIDHPGSTTSKLILEARRTGYGKARAGRGKSQAMARLLVLAGLRDPNATYPVGATPPRR